MKRALAIFFDRMEEIEAVAPVDILRRAGAEVVTAALGENTQIVGRSGISIDCDELFCDVADRVFDAVILAGGSGVYDILEMHPEDVEPLKSMVKRHLADGKLVAAICAAPYILDRLNLVNGRKCTAHTSVCRKIPNCDASQNAVYDGGLLTSKGAGTAVEFGIAVLDRLYGAEKAAEIAESICFEIKK